MQYEVTLRVSAAIPREQMDRDDYPIGDYRFVVVADQAAAAEELAEDALHEAVAMSRPEDFDIETLEIKPMTACDINRLFVSQP